MSDTYQFVLCVNAMCSSMPLKLGRLPVTVTIRRLAVRLAIRLAICRGVVNTRQLIFARGIQSWVVVVGRGSSLRTA